VTEPPAEPAEPAADESDITAEEIQEETEKGAESFIEAVSRIYRSREEADAAVSNISDNEIDEVVGDSEGSDVEAEITAEPAPNTTDAPAETETPAATDADEEAKAVEAYLNSFSV
jgi:hypothetical protein